MDRFVKSSGNDKQPPNYHHGQQYVVAARCSLVFVTVSAIMYYDHIQTCINSSYTYLLSTYLFNSVYFETFFATFCYAVITVYPWFISKIRKLDIYKIDPHVQYEHVTFVEIFKMLIVYNTPLMMLDTITVKKYHGVDPSVWTEKKKMFIQSTRALPSAPPSVVAIAVQLVASLILYDALFFIIHYALHKNFFLYKNVHRQHHEHGVLHNHVTNKLTIVERITLILSANFALKVFNSHPFTRMIFIPIFIGILIENHTGYDMPFGLHRIVPFGMVGGSVKHFAHHQSGQGNYQPIFTYLDKLLYLYCHRRH
ncbi:cholesterol 25-hydroxylase-like [Ruditapes philippinarum]|uniref:cholesterol 25-hydroxylase-like n=1 Tax=Ruditapes philippinarum TaxID=129788 RepID=UPI00295B445D|nr:cholesterol 25-hydroxylase-like [Ruditapes philippinarum]